jgi:acyl-ACP thioesterase
MEFYKAEYTLKNKDVDMFRKLRISRLFEMLQEAAIAHTEELGAGREKTLDKGFLWIVVQQSLQISRIPEYDETITVESWPGDTMHVLFPRYYRIYTKDGEELMTGSSLWTLVDEKTRHFIFPDKNGIFIPGTHTDHDPALPSRLPLVKEPVCVTEFTVPFSFCDLNAHMNNTRYFDVTLDQTDALWHRRKITSIVSEFVSEANYGETVKLSREQTKDSLLFMGENQKVLFKLKYTFE